MTLEVRRIVTGHDASGKAVVKTDERLTAVARLGHSDIIGCDIWSTDRMPVDNSQESDAAQRKGFVTCNLTHIFAEKGSYASGE